MLLSPVQPSGGKPSSASGFPKAGLCLRIIAHQPDSISPDQSPSKDPVNLEAVEKEETPLPSPDPIIIHSQAPLTPDSSPLAGPPPYQPPGSQALAAADRPSPLLEQKTDGLQPDPDVTGGSPSPSEISSAPPPASKADPSAAARCTVPRTLSAPVTHVDSLALGLAQSESLPAAPRVQLLEQASAPTTNRDTNQDLMAESEETWAADIS